MAYEFKMKRQVEFADTDMAGIMHFANFFRFMEVTEHAFYRSLAGHTIAILDERGTTPVPSLTPCGPILMGRRTG